LGYFDMVRDLILRNRSYRRFDATHAITRDVLEQLVDLARLSPSAANRQPLKYLLSYTTDTNGLIFPCLRWAAYLKDWDGPEPAEQPTAYIVILGDTTISSSFWCDHGIAAQSILLGAVRQGLGGCILGSIDRSALRASLELSDHYDILLIIALGKPCETVVIEQAQTGTDIKYWRDQNGTHHVPKRRLDDLIIN
jgi:nitroreductase